MIVSVLQYVIDSGSFSGMAKLLKILKINWSYTCNSYQYNSTVQVRITKLSIL